MNYKLNQKKFTLLHLTQSRIKQGAWYNQNMSSSIQELFGFVRAGKVCWDCCGLTVFLREKCTCRRFSLCSKVSSLHITAVTASNYKKIFSTMSGHSEQEELTTSNYLESVLANNSNDFIVHDQSCANAEVPRASKKFNKVKRARPNWFVGCQIKNQQILSSFSSIQVIYICFIKR